MSVYQDLFNQLKTQLEDDTELTALLAGDIVWGNQDAKVDDFPYLLVDPAGIVEPKATMPKQRWAETMDIELRGKVQDSVDINVLLKSFEIFEKVGNAIFSSATMDGLAVGMEFSMVSNNTIGNNVREVVMLLQIHSQTFQEDGR